MVIKNTMSVYDTVCSHHLIQSTTLVTLAWINSCPAVAMAMWLLMVTSCGSVHIIDLIGAQIMGTCPHHVMECTRGSYGFIAEH